MCREMSCPEESPNLPTIDFFLCGTPKEKVFAVDPSTAVNMRKKLLSSLQPNKRARQLSIRYTSGEDSECISHIKAAIYLV